MKAKHRHISEHRNIRQLWGCLVNAAGELQMPRTSSFWASCDDVLRPKHSTKIKLPQ
ncbi:hypothetical protein H257_16400 [Aphanomyces astaci]|uniref:Uncharacterized protein n=1 Tax=Aphanomyces astaci TaxID=112090 RepID=W4FKQ6_APHAT|nr:hypothetical protein H257_16400 [Aphanomyces astaci]ETV67424.1 hypothetical protein H257_16400 [Aphanomyces astaci]|eukprot:XP_009843115.1 hypothetical protein H257_16400 [Aphanomyces astaci]